MTFKGTLSVPCCLLIVSLYLICSKNQWKFDKSPAESWEAEVETIWLLLICGPASWPTPGGIQR